MVLCTGESFPAAPGLCTALKREARYARHHLRREREPCWCVEHHGRQPEQPMAGMEVDLDLKSHGDAPSIA